MAEIGHHDSGKGLILCAHGVGGCPGIADRYAMQIFARGGFAGVKACCLSGRPTLADAITGLAGLRITIVPYLMAQGFTAARMPGGGDRRAAGIRVVQPVGSHPGITRILERRAKSAAIGRGWIPEQTAVIVLAHGTTKDENSGDTARAHAARLDAIGGFAQVTAGFLEEEPRAESAIAATAPRNVVIVGLFADAGSHGETDAARLIAEAGARADYAGVVGTDPEMIEIILELAMA
jgi:sirohydrochlorin cobaltochelatase